MINFVLETFRIILDSFSNPGSSFVGQGGRGVAGLLVFLFMLSLLLAVKFTYRNEVKILKNFNNYLGACSIIVVLNFAVLIIVSSIAAIQTLPWLKIFFVLAFNIAVVPYVLKKQTIDFELEKLSDIFKIAGYFILNFTVFIFVVGLIVRICRM